MNICTLARLLNYTFLCVTAFGPVTTSMPPRRINMRDSGDQSESLKFWRYLFMYQSSLVVEITKRAISG